MFYETKDGLMDWIVLANCDLNGWKNKLPSRQKKLKSGCKIYLKPRRIEQTILDSYEIVLIALSNCCGNVVVNSTIADNPVFYNIESWRLNI